MKKVLFLFVLLLFMGCARTISIIVKDQDSGKSLKNSQIIIYKGKKKIVLGKTGKSGILKVVLSDIIGKKIRIHKKHYKRKSIEVKNIEGNSIEIRLPEKIPPKQVKNIRLKFKNEKAILKWDPSPSKDTKSYKVYFQKGLNIPKLLKKNITETSLKLGTLKTGYDYTFMVQAVDKYGNKNKGKRFSIYLGEVKMELPKTAWLKGKVNGLKGKNLYVVLYPLNLGKFGNYNVDPIYVKCDKSGKFESSLIPAGSYVVKAFEDLNDNGVWDGNWLGNRPEPFANAGIVKIGNKNNKTLPLIRLKEPVPGVPGVIYDENPGLVKLYQVAWEFAREKIKKGNTKIGFMNAFMDEGFNDHIYQWDTCFMMFFGQYGGIDFPSMNSVDNFYNKQRENGFICRVQSETTGRDYDPSKNDPNINPPLYAWIEYQYYLKTGDKSRILRALSHNHRYFQWIKRNCRTKEGYYFTSNLGSGMDNSPREGQAYGWIDITSQMALFAQYMSKLSEVAGLSDLQKQYQREYEKLKKLINTRMWDEKIGLYFDVKKNGKLHKKKTIASFWPLLARIVPEKRVKKLIAHLKDPNEFNRPHLFPTLSADEPEYDPKGYYWRGSVWAPTTFMVIKGLEYNGLDDFAYEASLNHITNMLKVYQDFVPSKKKLPYKQANIPFPADLDGTKQIWECYSPDKPEPATRWDNYYYVRPKFVGWSGVGPITLLIENVIGIRLNAPEHTIVWQIRSDKRHGIKNLHFFGGVVSLIMEKIRNGKPIIKTDSTIDFKLIAIYNKKKFVYSIRAK